ncbi:MAG: AMP-binding protein, partial [Burkholderiaceae bacterium]
LYLATLRSGATFVPLNTAYQKGEIAYFLQDAEPSVMVCAPAREAEIRPLATAAGVTHVYTLGDQRDGSLLAAAAGFPDEFATASRGPDDIAAILYTSGTTGRSKGAMLTHRNLSSNAQALDEVWGFKGWREQGRRDVLVHALPLFHVHGLFVASHAALLAGAKTLFMPKLDVARVLEWLSRATVFMGVPTYYTRLLAEPAFDTARCSGMRLFVCGSAPLLAETFDEFQRRTGHAIVERYGMSETIMLVSNPYFGGPDQRMAGTVGRALPGVSVRIVNDTGEAAKNGEIGNVEVTGPNVFAGYWRMPEKTREEFTADGWFKTGDVGMLGGPGKPADFLTLVGRSKDLIISGGYNVYPKEIEGYIDELAEVVESAVIGLPHPDFGEAVAAVVVVRSAHGIDGESIMQRLRGLIAAYKLPKRVFVVQELPRNTMGKVQKNILRDRYRTTFTPSTTRNGA